MYSNRAIIIVINTPFLTKLELIYPRVPWHKSLACNHCLNDGIANASLRTHTQCWWFVIYITFVFPFLISWLAVPSIYNLLRKFSALFFFMMFSFIHNVHVMILTLQKYFFVYFGVTKYVCLMFYGWTQKWAIAKSTHIYRSTVC